MLSSLLFLALVLHSSVAERPAHKDQHDLVQSLTTRVIENLSPYITEFSNPKSSTTAHDRRRDINLLLEPGFHHCPEWAGGDWCAEGYLCGDGHNGCEYGQCCNDDVRIAICTNEDWSPCSGASVQGVETASYYCCKHDKICGDGTACTGKCPKGECCDFDVAKADKSCGYGEAHEDCPSENLTDDCCAAPWDMQGNRLIDNARGDYSIANDMCLQTLNVLDSYSTDQDEEGYIYVKDCNYGLNSFEYVCQHEAGAICAVQMNLKVTGVDEEGGVHLLRFKITTYECVARECESDSNEDELELVVENSIYNTTEGFAPGDIDAVINCDPLPDIYDETGCSGLKMQGDDVKFCGSLMRENCSATTPPDTCGKCVEGYQAPSSGPNAACFRTSIVESHSVNGHMESAGIVFITMIVTLTVFGGAAYFFYRKKKKEQTDFLRAGQSHLIKPGQGSGPGGAAIVGGATGQVVPGLQEMSQTATQPSADYDSSRVKDVVDPNDDETALISRGDV